MEVDMEEAGGKNKQCVEMEESNVDKSTDEPMMTDRKRKKNKKKKQGQNKKLGVKFQIKKQEEVSLNIKKNWDHIKTPVKQNKVGDEAEEEEESDTMENKTSDQEESVKKTKKGKKPNKKDFVSPKMEVTTSLQQEIDGRTSHRNERTLYVRFPPSLSVREKSYVQPMVPTAVEIRFPRLSLGNFAKFCYVEFETEEEATAMKEKIEKIEVNGEPFFVDYVGKKSKAYNDKETRSIDPLRLYVGGLPKEVKVSDIRALFPTASQVFYQKVTHKVSQSYAYIIFKTHEEALKVFNASKNLKIQGKDVIVIFSTYKRGNESKENENQSVTPVTKKQKIEGV